jgi:hypothetical protein
MNMFHALVVLMSHVIGVGFLGLPCSMFSALEQACLAIGAN